MRSPLHPKWQEQRDALTAAGLPSLKALVERVNELGYEIKYSTFRGYWLGEQSRPDWELVEALAVALRMEPREANALLKSFRTASARQIRGWLRPCIRTGRTALAPPRLPVGWVIRGMRPDRGIGGLRVFPILVPMSAT